MVAGPNVMRSGYAPISLLHGDDDLVSNKSRAHREKTVLRVGRWQYAGTILKLPQQLTLGDEEVGVIQDAFLVQLGQLS